MIVPDLFHYRVFCVDPLMSFRTSNYSLNLPIYMLTLRRLRPTFIFARSALIVKEKIFLQADSENFDKTARKKACVVSTIKPTCTFDPASVRKH